MPCWGTGVRGEVKDPVKGVILAINASNNRVVSIDMPSGMGTEFDNAGRTMVHAWVTLTLEFPKLALLLPEAGDAAGRFVVLPIGLDQQYMAKTPSSYFYTGREEARQLIVPRHRFAHKGTHGHALLICGSRGMVGAAVMATRAALRSGCGLVTTHLPESERMVVQVACPSGDGQLRSGERFFLCPETFGTLPCHWGWLWSRTGSPLGAGF